MRACYCCGSTKTYSQNNDKYETWMLNHDADNNVLCRRCYMRYIFRSGIDARKGKRIRFKGKLIHLKWLERTGSCSNCHKKPKVTAMHHEHYIRILPWFSIVEYCHRCHIMIGIKNGNVNPARAAYIRDVKRGLYSI